MPRFDVLTFDCYGTLVDWETGIASAFAAATPQGIEARRSDVLSAYAAIEPAIQREAFRSYHEVLTLSAVQVANRLGWIIDRDGARFLPESLPTWPIFPDTNDALARLRDAGIELGILSNVDDDLLATTAQRLSVPFDFTVTAEHVRAYKPALAHFETARVRVGDRRWLHAAQSWFHDVEPATAAGIPVAWVNRKGEQHGDGGRPIAVVSDLEGLARWVLG